MGVGPGMFGSDEDWKWIIRFFKLTVFVLIPMALWKLGEIVLWLFNNVNISWGD